MPRTIPLSLLLPALLTATSWAMPAAPPVYTQEPAGIRDGGLHLRQTPARTDTVYFGGDDGTGTAFAGGVWDWDTIVGDPLQGWTSRDLTADVWDSFHRVSADSFTVHGDGCAPMLGHGAWQLWCGVHEDEADWRDFVSGMGYGNHSCQQALSPIVPISPGDSVAIGFNYFNDSEDGYDYTYAYISCYDAGGAPLEDGQVQVAKFDGRDGDYTNPLVWNSATAYAELPAGTAQVQLEFRFDSDGGYSDEDGHWATDCGPFAADDVRFDVGPAGHHYDFEEGTQGWSFARCPGVGAFMQVWPEAIWSSWLEEAGLACGCPLSGNALGFCDPDSPTDPPGFPVHHHEMAYSGVVDRGPYQSPDYNAVYVRMAGYAYLKYTAGSFVRPGYSIYPYVTDTNPTPHWSPRGGQEVWNYAGDTPYCIFDNGIFNWDLSAPPDGDPIPATWDQMKFILETYTDCTAFQIPTTACTQEGVTYGAPLIDLVQVGLTYAPDAPSITPEFASLLQDGFGQRFPMYLDPADVGDANISYDLSRDDEEKNDWLADTASIVGPAVYPSSPRRWLARLCVRIDRKGPRQETIPGYLAWKQRLAYAGDPEADYVCVQMDSVEITQGAYKNKYATFFHESEPGFDTGHADLSSWQEILPDSLWTPGTQLSYRFEARYTDASDWYVVGPYEFEILPGMRLVPGEPYAIEWPCVLYIDAGERRQDYYIDPALDALGLEHDRYDYQGVGGCCSAPLKRSFGGDTYNPGGWGNNGCSAEQLLGYRLILLDLGTFYWGSLEGPDAELLEGWLTTTSCGLADIRRGLVLSGDHVALAIGYVSPTLLPLLGVEVIGELETDGPYVWLEPPSPSELALRAPCETRLDVLDAASGVPGAMADLGFRDYDWPPGQYTQYARVMRENIQPGVANWKSIAHGFGLAELRDLDTGGQPVPGDSASIVSAILELLGPEVSWIAAGGAPFVAWQYPCASGAVGDEDEIHLSGPVDYLYPVRPNPVRGTMGVRFRLAKPGEATLRIYDLAGRCVRTLAEGAQAAGEQARVWDGTDDRGGRLGAGVYWVRLVAGDRYTSNLRMLRLR